MTSLKPLNDLSILVIEDGLFIAFALDAVLTDAGAKVTLATNLSQAQASLTGGTAFHLVILDIRLPDGDATELAQSLLQNDMPVIIHSAHVDDEVLERLSGAFICDKPATPQQIVNAVAATIKQSSVTGQNNGQSVDPKGLKSAGDGGPTVVSSLTHMID